MSHNAAQESVESQWEGVPIILVFLTLSISYSYYYVDIYTFIIQRITFPVCKEHYGLVMVKELRHFSYQRLFIVISSCVLMICCVSSLFR